MKIFTELGIILTICLIGEGISVLLPFTLPASVVSLILLMILLLTGVIKESYIAKSASFITGHMSFFFVPSSIGIMQYFDLIGPQLFPFLFITAITTPLIYCVTGWTVQLMIGRTIQKEESHD